MSYILYRGQPQGSSRGNGDGTGSGDHNSGGFNYGHADGCNNGDYDYENGCGDGWSPGGGFGDGRGDGDKFWITKENIKLQRRKHMDNGKIELAVIITCLVVIFSLILALLDIDEDALVDLLMVLTIGGLTATLIYRTAKIG